MNDMFQKIFDKLQYYLPEEWKKMIFYATYFEGSYSMKYYIKNLDGLYVDCYSAKNVSRIQLTKLFINLNKVIEPYRNQLEDSKKWSMMTMIIDSDGNVETHFDYDNVSEHFVEYENDWEKKYLL